MSKTRGRAPLSQGQVPFSRSLLSRRAFVRGGIGVGIGSAGLLTGCSSEGDGDGGTDGGGD